MKVVYLILLPPSCCQGGCRRRLGFFSLLTKLKLGFAYVFHPLPTYKEDEDENQDRKDELEDEEDDEEEEKYMVNK